MGESFLVLNIISYLRSCGYKVATEIPNFHRSADIVAVDQENNLIIIECKVSSISQAIKQLKTHRNAADKVYLGTLLRRTKKSTLSLLSDAGIGIIYVNNRGSVCIFCEPSTENEPWLPAKEKLLNRMEEVINGNTYL